ncbi:MAG: CheR family methyltransferase [Deltaproteobacteria bacterium]|nr:CheR family methyltransferase [Myxococcales bacterium]MDP3215640.1 CheR family methyltransferase [Deltaproteobacteria bacterium]
MSGEEKVQGEAAHVEDDPHGLEALLEHLQRSRGLDFRGYKRASLARRIRRRMTMLDVGTYGDYLDFLQVHPDEIPQLFNMLLINVTGFFRDPAAWAALTTRVEALLAARPPEAQIRVWSAGAATGEEAYTLAMMLAELMGIEALARRVKIYATDVDEDALNVARLATYSARAVESLPPELLAKYFTPSGSSFALHKDLRRVVLFGRHDLLQDAPISRIDVLVCRNTLMYFNAEAQTRVLHHLHFALAPDGVLFLGKAETLLTHLNLFTPLDLKLRLFGRTARTLRTKERLALLDGPTMRPDVPDEGVERVWRAAFDGVPMASMVVDLSGRLALMNRRAASLLGLHQQDLGRPFHDLEISYRPVDLRTLIDQARSTRRVSSVKAIERVLPDGERTSLDLEVSPLFSPSGMVVGTQITFADSTQVHLLHDELKKLGAELAASHEELQSTGEELETINEELQSTVEELETTNEELQSTNEELETMNEELQSSNEELQAMNDELRARGVEVGQANGFLRSILGSMQCGVAVLDPGLLVKAWNHRMEDLWGLRAAEVEGKHFLSLDIGLSIDDLRGPIRAVLAEDEAAELSLDCINRRGKAVRCRVSVQPLALHDGQGAILIVNDDEGRSPAPAA